MPEPDLIEIFAKPLADAGIRHVISGSVAAMLYGEPRVTLDIDFVIFLRAAEVSRLIAIFPQPVFYVPPQTAILEELARSQRGHFNVIHVESGLKADFYTAGNDELHVWAFQHLRKYVLGKVTVSLAPPEYVILRKLQFYREGGSEKHLRDIRSMLAISGAQIDNSSLTEWLDRLDLHNEWRRIGK
jgi:hypothetical protein